MSTYQPPIRDIRFVLNHVCDINALAEFESYSHASSDVVDAILIEAGKFAVNELDSINWSGDQVGSKWVDGNVVTPPGYKEAYLKFVENGWNGLSFDPEYGGQGLPQLLSSAVYEQWAAANLAWSICATLNVGAIEAVWTHGTEEQKKLYLEKQIAGSWSGTMNLTEPHAGSDVGAIKTKAIPVGDGSYKITGQKIFISYGEQDYTDNIIHLVLAKLPDAPAGTKGISCFIVPKFLVNPDGSLGARNDVKCVSIEHKLGIHGSPTCVMSYGDNGGAIGYLIGEENKGMRTMFTMMNNARLTVGLQGLGVSERAYQHAVSYALERKQGRLPGMSDKDMSPLVTLPDIRRSLMQMKAMIEAMRALAYSNAEALDIAHHHPDETARAKAQALADLLTPLSKSLLTESGIEITSQALQVFGGMGYVEETGAAQYYRDARITTIYEGTTAIQGLDLVGRKLGLRGGETVNELFGRMKLLDPILAGIEGESFAVMRKALATNVANLEATTEYMRAQLAKAPLDVFAGATQFQKQFALTVCHFLMAKSAVAAQDLLNKGLEDANFLKAKIATARFFSEQIAPQADGLAQVVCHGAQHLFDVPTDYLISA